MKRSETIIREKVFDLGSYMDVEIYPSKNSYYPRPPKRKILRETRPAQKRLNERNALKRLERLMLKNFSNDAVFLTLSFDEKHYPKNIAEGIKAYTRYLGRLRYELSKKSPSNFKYIYVASEHNDEMEEVRIHIHAIIEGIDMTLLKAKWGRGFVKVEPISDVKGGLPGLASYLFKQCSTKRRWSCSKGLKPVIGIDTPNPTKVLRNLKDIMADRENYHVFREIYPGWEYYDDFRVRGPDELGFFKISVRLVRSNSN